CVPESMVTSLGAVLMHLSDKRAQMFLMAVLIISLWAILMISAINELGEPEESKRADEDIEYVLSEIGRESNRRLEYYLSRYSNGEMDLTAIRSDSINFSRTLEMYAKTNFGITVILDSDLQLSENSAIPGGIDNGDRLFLNITGSIDVELYGTNSIVISELSIGVSVTVDILVDIPGSSTRLQIFKHSFAISRPETNATIRFTGPASGQSFVSYLNGTFSLPADLRGEILNVTTSDRIFLSSE
ncbi:MAG: hypothetical protein ACFFB3_20280, partial [Candidatus Hodarchaeota archaeon]